MPKPPSGPRKKPQRLVQDPYDYRAKLGVEGRLSRMRADETCASVTQEPSEQNKLMLVGFRFAVSHPRVEVVVLAWAC